jgi:hypothetical protein
MIAVGTNIAACQQAADIETAEPTKADEPALQENSDNKVMVLSKVMFMQL